MNLILLNSQSNQQIPLKRDDSFVIGRQNVFGCFDKKVSKNHGRITCTENGKINLLALHNNPCFFMRKGVPPVHRLSKGEEETLNEGDSLGLLPNSFWFQICHVKIKKEPEEANDKLCRHAETGKSELVRENEASTSKTQNVVVTTKASPEYSKRIGSPEFERTRRLPLYMYETDEVKESEKGSNATDNDIKTKKPRFNTDCKTLSGGLDNCGNNDKYNNNLEEPSTSRICLDATSPKDTNSKECNSYQEDKNPDVQKQADKPDKRPICKFEHDCFRFSVCPDEGQQKKVSEPRWIPRERPMPSVRWNEKNPQHKKDFSHPSDADYVPYEKRPVCRHGKSCYRRNTSHTVEFRHVPDSSSHDGSSNSSSSVGEERPPCFDGSSCLNQNLQHRKNFYHPPKGYICHFSFEDSSSCSSEDFEIYEDYLAKEYDSDFASSPLPPKRRRKRVKRNSEYEDADEDEYDLEDPFINDESSDEYVPSCSNSEEDFNESQEID